MKSWAFFLLIFVTSCKKSFQGRITYSSTFTNKVNNTTFKILDERLGTKQEFFIDGNNILIFSNGSILKSQVYLGSSNKAYTRLANDSLYWKSCDASIDPPTRYEIIKGGAKDTVLGLVCDVIIIYTKKSKTTNYYNTKFSVDPEQFKKCKYENRYFLYSKIKSIPLKTIYETSEWVLTSQAVEIEPMSISKSSFDLGDTSKLTPLISPNQQ
ncbi:hypothetical protein CJD36_010260 [Flavipsychrobacter stenotrophus]|uniref:Lipoprotein n=1 Tax=Flavipsychrobacter stenotrophus TaxID=2077091 RepID=A0A2S7SUQ3_9BACT|nr:hypothetical protein [Flavipsychrobacter stenotrophus]PQJ10351.1 hypothetical protein CJD36_010260 [Flavipsychrobacter stenotrophus]